MEISKVIEKYDVKNLTIGVLGSHSALDICHGSKKYGLKNLVVCEKGREKVYSHYYRRDTPAPVPLSAGRYGASNARINTNDTNKIGCVDEVLVLEKFKNILSEENQEILRQKNVIFVPHRSFEVYLGVSESEEFRYSGKGVGENAKKVFPVGVTGANEVSDVRGRKPYEEHRAERSEAHVHFAYKAIENDFNIPIFGNRYLLKIEERGTSPNQYDLLKEAGIRTPKIFSSPDEIDRPVIVKVLEKERGFERAFFLASSPEEYRQKSEELMEKGIITEGALEKSVIEEFILGVQINLNYFYSPIFERLEFLGSDTRRQTNLEGFLRLPASMQKEAEKYSRLTFEEAGHIAVTLLESLLEQVYEIGERFVEATKKFYPPGIIGPFALQCCVLPGPPKKEFVVFDVSPRVPGSPGIKFTPYSSYLFGESLSVGERIGMEIKEAIEQGQLSKIIS